MSEFESRLVSSCADGDSVNSHRGKYFTPIATEVEPSKQAQDKSLAEALWKFSEDFVNEHDA